MIAVELWSAFNRADFTQAERIVFNEVWMQTYGPTKSETARISCTEVGRRAGYIRQFISKGIVSLKEWGVLLEPSDGRYSIVKDYSKWECKGEKKLSPVATSYAASSPFVAWRKAPSQATKPTPEKTEFLSPNEVTHKRSYRSQPGDNDICLTPNEVTTLSPNEVTLHYRENINSDFNTEGEGTPPIPEPVTCEPIAPDDEPQVIGNRDGTSSVWVGQRTLTAAEKTDLNESAERLFPCQHRGRSAQDAAAKYGTAWTMEAMAKADAAGIKDWRYVLNTLKGYAASGGPPKPPPSFGFQGRASPASKPTRDEMIAAMKKASAEQERIDSERRNGHVSTG